MKAHGEAIVIASGSDGTADNIKIRLAASRDVPAWLALRHTLWPDCGEDEHRNEIKRFFTDDFPRYPWAALVAEDESGALVGFAELSVRQYAEGCRTNRVAYLEGWYVAPSARGCGIGRALVCAAEDWGRAQGCTEIGSDADIDNDLSAKAHRALGFDDVGLVRCFRKDI